VLLIIKATATDAVIMIKEVFMEEGIVEVHLHFKKHFPILSCQSPGI
jgi:hypothetical protein